MKKSALKKEIKNLRSDNERISYALRQEQESADISKQLLTRAVEKIIGLEEDAEILNDIIDSLAEVSHDNSEEAEAWHDEHSVLVSHVVRSLENLLHFAGHHASMHADENPHS